MCVCVCVCVLKLGRMGFCSRLFFCLYTSSTCLTIVPLFEVCEVPIKVLAKIYNFLQLGGVILERRCRQLFLYRIFSLQFCKYAT